MLGFFGPKTEQLVDELNTSDAARLETAIRRMLDRRDGVEHLCRALKNTNPWIRRGAAIALGRAGEVKAFKDLTLGLPRGDWDMNEDSEAFIEAVGQLGPRASQSDRQEAADKLARLLSDRMPSTIVFTVPHALARLGDRRGIPILFGQATSYLADGARIEAATALGLIVDSRDADDIAKAVLQLRDQLNSHRIDREDASGTEKVLAIIEKTATRLGQEPSAT